VVYRGLRPWQGIALGLVLSISVFGVAGCGGESPSQGGAETSKGPPLRALANSQRASEPAKAHRAPTLVAKGKRESGRAAPPPASPRVVHSSTAIGPAPDSPSSQSPRSHRKGNPRPSKPTQPAKPAVGPPIPPGSGADPYTAARNTCGEQANLDLVPPEYRGDPDSLATMYAQAFDPQHEQAAHDGCLAGLHSLGL
jgi:hypothetical protein